VASPYAFQLGDFLVHLAFAAAQELSDLCHSPSVRQAVPKIDEVHLRPPFSFVEVGFAVFHGSRPLWVFQGRRQQRLHRGDEYLCGRWLLHERAVRTNAVDLAEPAVDHIRNVAFLESRAQLATVAVT
jgi:hypothetical protein